MSFIKTLHLQNFRSYGEANLQGLASGFIVLTGKNGVGKTNILEAISLLTPGRGLRSADIGEMQKQGASRPWAVSARLETQYGDIHLGTGRDEDKKRRLVHIKGEKAKGHAELADYVSCLWLTPAMDRLFMDGSAARRKFLDRMVFAFEPSHAGRISRYENALSQRSKLLKDGRGDAAWLSALETQMAEAGTAIAAARLDMVEKLQTVCAQPDEDFPCARLFLNGRIEQDVAARPALRVESDLRQALADARSADAVAGGASHGPHKSDLCVVFAEKNMPADQCSTGEQKALLIGIVQAHAVLMAGEKGMPPILLLDEIAAHLDENRRARLFSRLQALGGQIFVTGTDSMLFSSVPNGMEMHVADGMISVL